MSYATEVYAKLFNNAQLTSLLPGGLYDHVALPVGAGSRLPAAAYTAGGRLKTCAIVKGRSLVPDGQIVDQASQYASARQAVEVWLYDDRDASESAMTAAAAQIYSLLQFKAVTGSFYLTLVNWYKDMRAAEYNDARMQRIDWSVQGRIKA